MQSINRTWLTQNRLWLNCSAATLFLGCLTAIIAFVYAPQAFSYWTEALSHSTGSLEDIQSEIAFEMHRQLELEEDLDSLHMSEVQLRSDQTIITEIQSLCKNCGVSLVAFDKVKSRSSNQGVSPAYRFQLVGRFHDLLELIFEIESSPQSVEVQSLQFEGMDNGSGEVQGFLVVNFGQSSREK